MIKVENITKRFGERVVLDDITATFERGKTNLIIGQSGSGKTVLMTALFQVPKKSIKLTSVRRWEFFFKVVLFSTR